MPQPNRVGAVANPARPALARAAGWLLAGAMIVAAWPTRADAQGLAASGALRPLPALALDPRSVGVSGLSSGGFMAAQFQVAHAASLKGAAIVAAGPYGCAQGSVTTAMFTCSCPYDTSAAEQGRDPLSDPTRLACLRLPAQVLADRGQRAMRGNQAHIDGTAALKRHRVWLYSGSDDPVVFPSVVDGAQAFFRAAGVPAARIQRVSGPRAGHGMPLPGNRNCHVTAPPFLNGCNIDGAGQLLRWIHDERAATAPTPGEAQPSGLQPFDQGPYRQAGVYDGLDDSGWLYVPAACASGQQRCGLHVAFHGCEQGQSFPMGPAVADGPPERFGTRFVAGAGYNPWAEAMNLVVLYPQVRADAGIGGTTPFRLNPKGCWDFWGYTRPLGDASLFASAPPHARRNAPQIRAVKAMVDALMLPRP